MFISTDEDPGLRIESFAVINLRGVSTNKTIIYLIAMQTYKELITDLYGECIHSAFMSTDEDPGLRIESFAVINLRGVSTNKTIIYLIAMQTYKELITDLYGECIHSAFISTDEDPGLRIESFAVINLRGVSTNKTIIYLIAMQTYKELITDLYGECIHSAFISTDEDPGLRIESFAVINLRGVSTNKTIIYLIAMQTYKELITDLYGECIHSAFISTDEDPGLRIESFAVINLRGVSTNKTIIYLIAIQTYKELITNLYGECIHSAFISTDEDPGLRIESFAVINLRGVSTNKTIIYLIAMQTYKELIMDLYGECIHSAFISTDEDPGLRIESFAVINLRGVSTNKTIIYLIAMQTYKELITDLYGECIHSAFISTDEDPGLRIESFAVINLRGVSTNKTIIYLIAIQTCKELITDLYGECIHSAFISTDEDPGLRIESFAVINLRGVSTNKTII